MLAHMSPAINALLRVGAATAAMLVGILLVNRLMRPNNTTKKPSPERQE